jgi:catechol 2,3-dioxygenase-like lactoylglutathione lyase family enzyme
MDRRGGLFRKVDCVRVPVPDLDGGLAFYRDALGHELIWRTATAAGLRLPDSEAEIVLHTDGPGAETDFGVYSVADAVAAVLAAGGSVLVPVRDPDRPLRRRV